MHDIWMSAVTLTLDGAKKILFMTRCPNMIIIFANSFQNPLRTDRFIDRTRNDFTISILRMYDLSSVHCDLDLWPSQKIANHDKSSQYDDHLCQLISKPLNEWQIYRPEMNEHVLSLYPYRDAWPLNVHCDLDPSN